MPPARVRFFRIGWWHRRAGAAHGLRKPDSLGNRNRSNSWLNYTSHLHRAADRAGTRFCQEYSDKDTIQINNLVVSRTILLARKDLPSRQTPGGTTIQCVEGQLELAAGEQRKRYGPET